MTSATQLRSQPRAFALVITLIMVVLAAVIVVAMLSNATLERGTAKSGNDRYQAEVAAQNGLEAAKKALVGSPTAVGAVTLDDTFLVLRAEGTQAANASGNKDTYYFMAKARAGTVDCYPLFSGGVQTSVGINATTSVVTPPTAPAGPLPTPAEERFGNTVKMYPPLLSFQQSAYTQWQEVHDPNDTATAPPFGLPYQRYTFWVEDLSGYLDASVVGNVDSGGNIHQRDKGTNPKEIALFTIFEPDKPVDPGTPSAKNLVDNRPVLLSVPTIKQVAQATGVDATQPNLAVRLGIDTDGEQELVPFGYSYPSTVEGKPKTDLKQMIAAKNVNGIAGAIATALPSFATRKGGLANPFDYTKNLAANIIDYATPSGAPTTDGTIYRGIGAFPFIVSAFDLNNWVRTNNNGGEYSVDVEVTTFVQLWNPHNVPVSGNMTLHYDNVDKLTVNGSIENYAAPPDLVTNVSLSPNQYKVFAFPIKTYNFDWGPTPPSSGAFIPFPGTTNNNAVNSIRMTWNGQLADLTNKKMERSNATVGMKYNPNRGASNASWRGNAAPPIYPNTGTPGDPRISFYLNRPWTVANYSSNSSWGGRLILSGVPQQMQPSIWPDGGHDSTLGKKPTGDGEDPIAAAGRVTLAAADANKWISRLSTGGPLATLAELGNVFDPGQWSYPIPSVNTTTGLPDIPATATADGTAGGGYSLSIGRPEFSKFDKNGQRSWQLLDVFALGSRRVTTGLVNLNTASPEVLRSLAAGLLLNRDPAGLPAVTIYPPKSSNSAKEADLFAQAVVSSRPLLSIAQLQTVANGIGPFFGNPKQWGGETGSSSSSAPPTEWNDSGREELFSKVLNLTTVRSRNFRVFVTGQSLDKNGKVLSTVSKVFQVFLKPTRNQTTGQIQSQQVEVMYEAFL